MLIKFIAVSWSGLAVAGARGGIAAIFLLLTHRGLRFHFSRDQCLAAILYAACTVTFCLATTLTSAANAILLQYTAPVWVALLGATLTEGGSPLKDTLAGGWWSVMEGIVERRGENWICKCGAGGSNDNG